MTAVKTIRRLVALLAVMMQIAGARAAVAAEQALLEIALDPQANVVERTRAFSDLRAVATDAAIPSLAKWLNDPEWAYPARSVLEAMPGRAADQALLEALESVNRSAQLAGLIHSAGSRRHAGAVPAIAKFLASRDLTVVRAALDALAEIGVASAADAMAAFEPPLELRPAWSDALLRVAEALQRHDRGKSLELYQRVVEKGSPPQQGAAVIGLAHLSERPVGVVTGALQSAQPASRQAALALLQRGALGPEFTSAAGRIFSKLSPDVQVQVLAVLEDRRDPAAVAIGREAIAGSNAAVRAAAAKLLSVVGEPVDAPALIVMMAGPDAPAAAARLALSRIPGKETDARLVERFRANGLDREAALEVLVRRGYRPLVEDLLQVNHFADPAAARLAASAIQALGTGADLERVLRLHRQLEPGQRNVLEGAVRRLAAKHTLPDDAAAIIHDAAQKLPLVEATPLFVILAGIGGERAVASLSALLKSSSVEARRVALLALGSGRDLRPMAVLLATAQTDADATMRAAAVEAALALLKRNAMGGDKAPTPKLVPDALHAFRQMWALAETSDAKRAVLAGLRGLKEPKATAMADALENEAHKN